MKKVFKQAGIIFTILISLLIVFMLAIYINHKIQLSKEDSLFRKQIGQSVEVNGHLINVYTTGTGNVTLVFLSGGGTSSPVLDFKSLYSLLSDTYKIVVVEKAGYGFSEITDTPRDIDTVLSETRQALILSGIPGPYILCPHSMSGIEALYWAHMYPEEVSAIIGLDMSVPQSYIDFRINKPLISFGAFAANIGITRLIPGIDESDAIKYGTLSEEEKELYRVIFYRRTATKNMLNELAEIKNSAEKVAGGGTPDVPILIFSSNGQGTGWDKDAWKQFQKSFIESCQNGKLIEIDSSHYLQDIEYNKIAQEMKKYINELKL